MGDLEHLGKGKSETKKLMQPTGREILPILTQLWKEQEQVVLSALRLFGLPGLLHIPLERWTKPLIDRVEPLFEEWYLQGRVSFEQTLENQKKSVRNLPHFSDKIKRGAGVILNPWTMPTPTDTEVEESDWFDVFDPNVAKFAREWAYEFAQSTLATTQERIFTAYKMTADAIAGGLERGESLAKLTNAIGLIFNDPNRAMMIAATESARSYNYGQLETAKESGEVAGVTWMSSADACPVCLELNGKTVRLGEPFVTGPGKYGTVFAPPRHPNCFCTITYELSPINSAANQQFGVAA